MSCLLVFWGTKWKPLSLALNHRHHANCTTNRQWKNVPWWEIVFLEYVEMEERRGQAHGNVHGCHLVLLHRRSNIAEETEQRLQHLSVFIWHQHDGCLDSLQPLVLRHIYTRGNSFVSFLLHRHSDRGWRSIPAPTNANYFWRFEILFSYSHIYVISVTTAQM